ncbi:hypothetical protein GCM10027567_16530 [Spongiibacter taiwanensis]
MAGRKMSKPEVIYITNMYPSEERPYYGTFVQNSFKKITQLGRYAAVIALNNNKSKLMSYIFFYCKTFSRLVRFDGIAYIHYVTHSAPPALVAKLFNPKLKIILHFHGSDAFPEKNEGNFRRKIKKIIAKSAIRLSYKIVVPSDEFKGKIVEAYGIDGGAVFVNASAGVDASLFKKGARKQRSADESSKKILFVGRMIDGKGALLFARILAEIFKLPEMSTGVSVTFVGQGPEKQSAQKILENHIASGSVGFVDFVSQAELVRYYQEADIFIFASTREGESLGLVLIEAIFCGAVPIALRNVAASSILKSDSSGFLVAESENDMKEKLVKLLRLKREELELINSELIEENKKYDAEQVGLSLNEILQ